MRIICSGLMAAIFVVGFLYNGSSLTGSLHYESEGLIPPQSFERIRHFALQDGLPPSEEFFADSNLREALDPALSIQHCTDSPFEYMASSPYYRVFFKGTVMRMIVQGAWIEFELPCQNLGEIKSAAPVAYRNSLSLSDVFESVDLSYTVESSFLQEVLRLNKARGVNRVIVKISWEGLTPEFTDNGSILFVNEDKSEVLKILPPFMKDAEGNVCTDMHYELVETETGYELHKVIDEKGFIWLQKAVYPVIIDPSIQTFEDAWESSGFQLYGQYFQNLQEYVNPANGHLTIMNTDLVIPGRGLDLVISRIYETLALFYQAEPYDYQAPPVNVGKGWMLDFPYIGGEYVHLWGGTLFKIEWVNNTFDNHTGAHFILVRNLDNTYTLTMANGNTCEFDTAGKLTQYRDMDQNAIIFSYNVYGKLISITDTIGRAVDFIYSDGYLSKIIYNGAELEYGYDGNGNLIWMEDFLNRRTSFYYNAGWYEWAEYPSGAARKPNVYLLSQIVYTTGGYTTYSYNRFSYEDVYGDDGTCFDYFKYYVTNQRVYEINQVRHTEYTYTGNFTQITSCTQTVKNQSDVTQGSYQLSFDSIGLTYQKIVKNASGTPIRKYSYTHNSRKELIQEDVYNDGSNLSFTNYYGYDNWGNVIYMKNAEGHEGFMSYANTSTSGFFVDNTGTVIRQFSNAFASGTVSPAVHTVLLGRAEKQDNTFVREAYFAYDSEAHPTQLKNAFGVSTTYLTFFGTFNEKTGNTYFSIDLTGHTTSGNAVLQIVGIPSDDAYQESHSAQCHTNPTIKCTWTSGDWSGKYYNAHWTFCGGNPLECDDGWASIGPFTHCPGTLGYQGYTITPSIGGKSNTFTVTTNWRAYPAQVQYNIDESPWEIITSDLQNNTITIPVTISNGLNTFFFSESSNKLTKFYWCLYIPVDNNLDTYVASLTYDTYGNITSITDAESNTINLTYSPAYSYSYLTEISATVGSDTITKRATYDYYWGWTKSVQQPIGVQIGSGYDTLYTYDILGRVTRKEFPLLPDQSRRSYVEAIYDCENRTVTLIDQFGHYVVQEYDKLGRIIHIKLYTGSYGSGILYATKSYCYRYDNLPTIATDTLNHATTQVYDFLGRKTQIQYPDSSTVSFSYIDTYNKTIFTNGREFDRIYWLDWLGQLEKVEEEYATGNFAVTTYQYDEVGHLISFTDAENHTSSSTYASLFGLTRITYPDSTHEEYEYSITGNLLSFTDAEGNKTKYTYDSAYRLIQIQYQDQSSVSFAHDLNSNRIRMNDNAPNADDYVEYSYDYWNRLISESRHISQDTYTITYEYDVTSRLTKLTYPDDMQILYLYDDLGRTAEVKCYTDGVHDEILMDNIQYTADSFLIQADYGNHLRAIFSYDLKDRLSSINVRDGDTFYLDLSYTYDSCSNITKLINGWRDTDYRWHSQTESYAYDGLDRLTSANCTSWSHAYSYDKVGNRVVKDGVTYTINSVNEVTGSSDGTSFAYDFNGNRIQKTQGDNTWEYSYDCASRLMKIEKDSLILGEYIYDGDGKRIQVRENSVMTTYLYSGINVLYEETSIGTATYIYGPTGRLAKRTTISGETNTFYYHTDHVGSTRLVTNQSKNIVTEVSYHPFGEPTEAVEEPHLFTGKEKDATGLYYYGARYYDPDIGRFTTRDPLAGERSSPQSSNRYAYCANNPVKLVDLAGLAYSTCDVVTGECKHYSEFGLKGLRAYDSEGNIIFDSFKVQAKIDEGDYVGAVKLILAYLGYEIKLQTVWNDQYGNEVDVLVITIEGKDAEIYVYDPGDVGNIMSARKMETWTLGGKAQYNERSYFVKAFVSIYFYSGVNMTAEHLFHTVGHELEHARHYCTGLVEQWYTVFGNWDAVEFYSEFLAYKWNLAHLHIASWPGAQEEFEFYIQTFLRLFFKSIK
ncbi:MAG: RHS repeat protein [Theionarchaea archaeon]|nr:RHS repeat protein [Theionarchaea archaeon]